MSRVQALRAQPAHIIPGRTSIDSYHVPVTSHDDNMRFLFDVATDTLHDQISDWAHSALHPSVVVRRLLPGNNTITVDIIKPHPLTIDRFVVSFGLHTEGNRATDSVNLLERKLPTAITVTAGTLNTIDREVIFYTHEALWIWMLSIARVCNL